MEASRRLATGVAIGLLSFAPLARNGCAVAGMWHNAEDKAARAGSRAIQHYENLRLVYEIESRLAEWRDQ